MTETPRLDAEVLLSHVLGRNRTFLRGWPESVPNPAQRAEFERLLDGRIEGRPIAYLIGEREFWSRSFRVRPGVLIPRPETELLIELALARLPAEAPARLLELGTGSGIIAITLAVERPRAEITATDLSADALAIARENAERIGVKRIQWLRGAWLQPFRSEAHFDLIVSNPPYIAEQDPHLGQGDLRFEPRQALASGTSGLEDLDLIARGARRHLKRGGHLILEHGYDQAGRLAARMEALGYREIVSHRDLQGHTRATSARRD